MTPRASVRPTVKPTAAGNGENTGATQRDGHRTPLARRIRGNVCWAGWASALALVLFVLLSAGCQSSEPVVPREIFERVNNDGREWTYDTAWQNIRRLNADLDSGELETVTDDALFVVSQMERLEKAKATAMTSSATARLIEEVRKEAATRSTDTNVNAARVAAQRLQDAFDAGDFLTAKEAALEVHVISQELDKND
jgi:hypothetical protein